MRYRFTLKRKLLVFSLAIFFIPWIGYKYVRGMEDFLKTSMEDAINIRAHSIAMVLRQQPAILNTQSNFNNIGKNSGHLYLRTLEKPVQLDGYTDDWQNNQDLFQEYNEQHILAKASDYRPNTIRFSQATGQYKQYLYALFKVSDDRIVYHDPNNQGIDRCDFLNIGIQTPAGDYQHYTISTAAPGRLSAQLMSDDTNNTLPTSAETRIQGVWQETADGYTLELRMPLSMIGNKLSFSIHDIDDPQTGTSATVIGSANIEQASSLSTIVIPSTKLEGLLTSLGMASSRIWVIDKNKRVLALSGNLNAGPSVGIDNQRSGLPAQVLSALYRLILQQPASAFEDILSGVSKLNGREIESALQGKATSSWRESVDKNATILTASYPIINNNEVIGAVMLEQNSQRILLLQNRAMEDLINLSIPVFLGGTLLILIFAGRITSRITHLRDQTEQAINADGKVNKLFQASAINDEIGDLSRSFSDLLTRLQQYNRYLETMASKLSHELRTPLSVVRSSLDNLEQIKPDMATDTYMHRAKNGIEQLNGILNRLSEATRLEQALQQTEKEKVDLPCLLEGCVDGYRMAYPDHQFVLNIPDDPLHIIGAPDLLVQMLDKLISNAVDFSLPDTPICLSLSPQHEGWISLTISNQGPHLPSRMQANLFDSMVSLREKSGRTAHLGLGLYIVRLVIEYHQGRIEANNTYEPDGVAFSLFFKES